MEETTALPDRETRHSMAVIARHILNRLTDDRDRVAEMREDYPEIGQHDWLEIVSQVSDRAKTFTCSEETYTRAYEHLKSRAGHGADERQEHPPAQVGCDCGLLLGDCLIHPEGQS